jgi:type II secretory pathway component PulF
MSMLEPIMIIGLGGIVMLIVVSVFLPMIQVITSLSAAGG